MKKMLVTLFVFMMLFLCSCGKNEGVPDGQTVDDAVALLNSIWQTYDENEKFAVAGGDYSNENNRIDEAGVYDITDATELDYSLGFPKDYVGRIDQAASLVHMMNANTFTCGAYHIKNSADKQLLAGEIKSNIEKRQWMCGFPDKYIIGTVGDYMIAAFGKRDIIDTFKSKISAIYENADFIYEDNIE